VREQVLRVTHGLQYHLKHYTVCFDIIVKFVTVYCLKPIVS
jgi:hypothetical protein